MAARGVALVDAVYEAKLAGGGRLQHGKGGRGQPNSESAAIAHTRCDETLGGRGRQGGQSRTGWTGGIDACMCVVAART